MNRLKPLEKMFKAAFFATFRRLLRKGRKDFRPLDGSRIRSVLFLRPEKIGDMVISFPVFDGLRKTFPHIRIAVLGSPRNYEIIKNDPRFDKVYLYRKNVRDLLEVFAMRRARYDCVVDMIGNDSVTALFLSQLCARGKPRIGVGKKASSEYYDFNYDHRLGNTGHIVENTLKLLTAFGIDTDTIDPYAPPFIEDAAWEKAETFLAKISNGLPRLKIGYNLSAGSPTRVWAMEKSRQLVNRICDERKDSQVVLITAPSERKRADELEQKLGLDRVCQSPPKLSLTEVSALVAKLDLLISPDTSLVHIARAFKVPVVGLYSRYMKNFLLWRPYDQQTGAVVSDNDDNIFDITVDQVFDVFSQVLELCPVVER
jgi:ADP-heptose:LPS heptosyltransferase